MSEGLVLELVSEILGIDKAILNQEVNLSQRGWDSLSTLALLAKIDSLNLENSYSFTIDEDTTIKDLITALA
jgi:acyl carrier protein